MSRRSFTIFTMVAFLSVAAAGVSLILQDRERSAASTGEPAAMGLMDRINDVYSLVLERASGTLTLRRVDRGWVLVERGDYPVRSETVKTALLQLAQLMLLEPKTRKPERFEKLDVQPPEVEDSRSTRLSLLDSDGQPLTRLVVGRRKYNLGDDGAGGVYVRKPDEAQSWLAKGSLDLGIEARHWLDRDIVDVKADRIARVIIHHPDGQTITAIRSAPGDAQLILEGLPEGAQLKSDGVVDDLATPYEGLILEDVQPADRVTFAAESTVETEIRAFDGLVLRIALTKNDGKNWMRLEASVEEAAEAAQKPDDVTAEAEQINSRSTGWAYQIPEYRAFSMRKQLTDLVAADNDTK